DDPGGVAVGVVVVQRGQRPVGGERRVHPCGQATLVIVVAGGLAGLVHLLFDGAVRVVMGRRRPRGRAGRGQRLDGGGGVAGQVVAVQGGVRGGVGRGRRRAGGRRGGQPGEPLGDPRAAGGRAASR